MYVGGGTYLVVLCHIISEPPQLPSSNSLQTTSPFHSTGRCLKMISITTLQQVLLLEESWMTCYGKDGATKSDEFSEKFQI